MQRGLQDLYSIMAPADVISIAKTTTRGMEMEAETVAGGSSAIEVLHQ